MVIELKSLIFALSIIIMFIYQYSIFSYSSSLLVGSTKKKWIFAILALLNSIFFAYVQYIELDLYIIIIIFLVMLTFEFKLISKTDMVQVFCGASIFVLHIFAFITPVIIVFSSIFNISPAELIKNSIYDHFAVMIICVLLSCAHEIVKKYIDNLSIQRVTVKSKHSIILLCSIVLIVFLQVHHASAMMTEVFYPEQLILSFAVSLTSLFTFYLFFLYAISLIDASLYKRYSDQVIGEQKIISKQKENLLTKIERDELTGVFNRGFIMNELERMCENEKNSFYVLFIDINGLKYTNDTYGHKAGDKLITKISHAVLNSIRENDLIARIGGDEFLVIIPNAQEEDSKNLIKRISTCIELQNRTEEFLISASIGSIFVDENAKKQGVSHILSIADENMRKNKELFYKSKESGTL